MSRHKFITASWQHPTPRKPCLLGRHLPITQLKSLKSFPIPLVSHDVGFYGTTKITQPFWLGVFLLVVGKKTLTVKKQSKWNYLNWNNNSIFCGFWSRDLSWPPLPTIFTLEDLNKLNSLISEKASGNTRRTLEIKLQLLFQGTRAFLTEKIQYPCESGILMTCAKFGFND